jgi:uncharacterized protein (DUF433 family)
MSEVIGAFGEEHAEALTGVSRKQLRHWDRIGLLRPSFADEPHVPFGRIYSFRDLVSLRVLNELRNEIGCSLPHLLEVSKKLALMSDDPWSATTLYVLNKHVVIGEPGTNVRLEIVSGQRVLDIPLRFRISSMRSRVAKLNERGPDEIGKVVSNKFVSQGQDVVKGTRVPVSAIKSFASAGYSAAAIVKEYPSLTVADVEAVIAYQDDAAA